jgi:hypothetical protein
MTPTGGEDHSVVNSLTTLTVGAVIISAIYSVSLEFGECSQGKVVHVHKTVFSVIILM